MSRDLPEPEWIPRPTASQPSSSSEITEAIRELEDSYHRLVVAHTNPQRGAKVDRHRAARSRLESLYLEQLQEIERMDWLVGAYLGADFKYDYAGQEVSVLLIGIPKGARISNDFRETISALRGISTKGTAEK